MPSRQALKAAPPQAAEEQAPEQDERPRPEASEKDGSRAQEKEGQVESELPQEAQDRVQRLPAGMAGFQTERSEIRGKGAQEKSHLFAKEEICALWNHH